MHRAGVLAAARGCAFWRDLRAARSPESGYVESVTGVSLGGWRRDRGHAAFRDGARGHSGYGSRTVLPWLHKAVQTWSVRFTLTRTPDSVTVVRFRVAGGVRQWRVVRSPSLATVSVVDVVIEDARFQISRLASVRA